MFPALAPPGFRLPSPVNVASPPPLAPAPFPGGRDAAAASAAGGGWLARTPSPHGACSSLSSPRAHEPRALPPLGVSPCNFSDPSARRAPSPAHFDSASPPPGGAWTWCPAGSPAPSPDSDSLSVFAGFARQQAAAQQALMARAAEAQATRLAEKAAALEAQLRRAEESQAALLALLAQSALEASAQKAAIARLTLLCETLAARHAAPEAAGGLAAPGAACLAPPPPGAWPANSKPPLPDLKNAPREALSSASETVLPPAPPAPSRRPGPPVARLPARSVSAGRRPRARPPRPAERGPRGDGGEAPRGRPLVRAEPALS